MKKRSIRNIVPSILGGAIVIAYFAVMVALVVKGCWWYGLPLALVGFVAYEELGK